MKDTALVLEGGGMRGIYTAGILDFFLDKNLNFPYVIGVSAGACNGTSYISGQRDRNKKVIMDYVNDSRYIGYRNLIREKSIFGIDFAYNQIPNKLEPFDFEAFFASKQKFIMVTTNCATGLPEYFEKSDCKDIIMEVIRASSSLPFVCPIVDIHGKPLLDGGIADSIPIKKSLSDGNKKNVVVLTRDRSYRKKPAGGRFLTKKVYSKYEKLIEAIFNRYKIYNETLDYIEKLEDKGEIFVISPKKPVEVGRLEKNLSKLEALYDGGYKDAEESYEALKKWMDA